MPDTDNADITKPPLAPNGKCADCWPGDDGRHTWACPHVPADLFLAALANSNR